MARPTGLQPGRFGIARSATALIVADNATLTDANIPPAQGINCHGLDSIFVTCDITGGASPTLTVEPLFYDIDAADGSRWRRLSLGALPGVTAAAVAIQTPVALTPLTTAVEFQTFGHTNVFLRITAVANPGSTTAWSILVMPGRIRDGRVVPVPS